MKKLFFFFIVGLFSVNGFCQSNGSSAGAPPSVGGGNGGLISSNNRMKTIFKKGKISYEEALSEYFEIDGSPFLKKGKIVVDLIYYNDSLIKDVTILYDLYNLEIVVKSKDGSGDIILDQLYYKGFIYNNKGVEEEYRRVHPTKFQYYKILFENEDFIFCKGIKTTVSEDTRYIPGQDKKSKKFVHREKHYIIQGDKVKESKLRKEAMLEHLPQKYKAKISSLKNKLKIKKLNKEKDYILLMESFEN